MLCIDKCGSGCFCITMNVVLCMSIIPYKNNFDLKTSNTTNR